MLKIKPNFFVVIVFSFSFFPAVHIVAHLFNFEFFMDAQLNRNSSSLPFVLSEIGTGDNASFLNPIRSNETVSQRSRTAQPYFHSITLARLFKERS